MNKLASIKNMPQRSGFSSRRRVVVVERRQLFINLLTLECWAPTNQPTTQLPLSFSLRLHCCYCGCLLLLLLLLGTHILHLSSPCYPVYMAGCWFWGPLYNKDDEPSVVLELVAALDDAPNELNSLLVPRSARLLPLLENSISFFLLATTVNMNYSMIHVSVRLCRWKVS